MAVLETDQFQASVRRGRPLTTYLKQLGRCLNPIKNRDVNASLKPKFLSFMGCLETHQNAPPKFTCFWQPSIPSTVTKCVGITSQGNTVISDKHFSNFHGIFICEYYIFVLIKYRYFDTIEVSIVSKKCRYYR